MDVNQVLEAWGSSGERLGVRTQDDVVIIEGSDAALRHFGELLMSMSNEIRCGLQLSPTGAAAPLFLNESKKAIYLHQLPCSVIHPVPDSTVLSGPPDHDH